MPIGTGEASMMAWRMASMSPPVERSMTVSAPRWTAVCSFSSSSSTLLVTAELPMLALILHVRGDADAHRLEPLGEVDLVGGDDHAAAGHLVADQFGVEVLALGDEAHLVGDDALAGGFELRHGDRPFTNGARSRGGQHEAHECIHFGGGEHERTIRTTRGRTWWRRNILNPSSRSSRA